MPRQGNKGKIAENSKKSYSQPRCRQSIVHVVGKMFIVEKLSRMQIATEEM